ncbi:histone chaperone domain CHZ-domain-containing protein [Bisporella sp. PMI_857]|nr:histone chaperone domain CHZ-domain-containing protein [Bisporella sp. PMI_857]
MSEQNGSATAAHGNESIVDSKGKGKAVAEPEAMEEDSSSEDEVDEDAPVADEADEDNMEEIDTDNIIQDGRRTRGRQIDFAKAAAELGEEEDSEDDDDFEAPVDEDSEMKD